MVSWPQQWQPQWPPQQPQAAHPAQASPQPQPQPQPQQPPPWYQCGPHQSPRQAAAGGAPVPQQPQQPAGAVAYMQWQVAPVMQLVPYPMVAYAGQGMPVAVQAAAPQAGMYPQAAGERLQDGRQAVEPELPEPASRSPQAGLHTQAAGAGLILGRLYTGAACKKSCLCLLPGQASAAALRVGLVCLPASRHPLAQTGSAWPPNMGQCQATVAHCASGLLCVPSLTCSSG